MEIESRQIFVGFDDREGLWLGLGLDEPIAETSRLAPGRPEHRSQMSSHIVRFPSAGGVQGNDVYRHPTFLVVEFLGCP